MSELLKYKKGNQYFLYTCVSENDSIVESHFVFHYSSNQYLWSVHYVYNNILYSREVTNTDYMTTAREELII